MGRTLSPGSRTLTWPLEQLTSRCARLCDYSAFVDDVAHALRWSWHVLCFSHWTRFSSRFLPLRFFLADCSVFGYRFGANCSHLHRQRSDVTRVKRCRSYIP